jgi:cytochrome b561
MPASASPHSRYSTVAIWLHWIIAILILANVALGFGHEWVAKPISRQMMWFHQSIGLTVLILSGLRLCWRLGHPVPALPDHMPGWEKVIARLTHWGFYVLMVGLPLAGWAMRSASPKNPPIPFWGVNFPKIPGFDGMTEAARKTLTHQFGETHEVLAWIAIVLVVLHVAAALKHQFWNKDVVVHHMLPMVKPGVDARLNAEAAAPGREI